MTPPSTFSNAVWRRRALPACLLALIALAACSDAPTDNTTAADAAALARAPRNTSTIQVTVGGLPAGVAAQVSVIGPGGYSTVLTGTSLLTELANGTYTLNASAVSANGATYTPSPSTQSVAVKNGSTASASISYSAAVTTGTLVVSVTMPDATPASIAVTGPNGFSRSISATTTLSSLAPGAYTVTASPVTSASGATLSPSPASQSASVTAGTSANAGVTYTVTSTGPEPGINLLVGGMYLTQSVQTLGMGVPLVTGRDGVLRVFALATASNSAQPAVRARFYRNGTLVSTINAAAQGGSVPTSLAEGTASASWNVVVPGSIVQPGLSVVVDVDPANAIAESNEGDNQYPAAGPVALDVRTVPNYAVRFVPITQSGTGATGGISDASRDAFLQRARDLHPLNTITSSVRAAYTTSLTLQSGGTNWSNVLGELRALRTTDGASDAYYGVVKVGYSSGVAGIGYLGLPVSMGWDHMPSGSEVMAHEIGHTWNRQHAPCGGVANPDPNFPYAGGTIGVYGFNVRLNSLIAPSATDLMGYCGNTWISDYNYKAIMNYRGTSTQSMVVAATVQPSLLVWGTVRGDGTIDLEPSAHMNARSVLPAAGGQYTVEGTDASGATLFSVSFNPDQVADETGGTDRHFAFLVPLDETAKGRLVSVRARGNGRSAERSSRLPAQALENAAAAANLDADGNGRARLRWNGGDLPLVVVRNLTGAVLSFARGGDLSVASSATEVELIVSDGVRSVSRRASVRGR